MEPPQPHRGNRLWIARKKIGLGQKVVAQLLGHKTTSVISEYETGKALPGLRTALKLSVIYNMPVRELFAALHYQLSGEVEAVRKQLPCFMRAPHDMPNVWDPSSKNREFLP